MLMEFGTGLVTKANFFRYQTSVDTLIASCYMAKTLLIYHHGEHSDLISTL